MIRIVDRNQLNEAKYNACIYTSTQSLIYGYSWYLDIVCDAWRVLVLNDYQAVMPIPVRKKYGISYVYPPFWMLQLGIFSQDDSISEGDFIKFLLKEYRFVELRLNSGNSLLDIDVCEEKYFQHLNLEVDYDSIFNNYQSDRKKDLKKAKKFDLQARWNDDPTKLIELFKANVGQRTPEIQQRDYLNLLKLIKVCGDQHQGDILSVYHNDDLVASGFFLKHQQTVTILCSSTDFSNRNNGANTFLIDTAIQKYKNDFKVFNFGGSSMKSVADYFFSFGAEQISYPFLQQKKWPALLRFLKP
jgi:hypothetical protein